MPRRPGKCVLNTHELIELSERSEKSGPIPVVHLHKRVDIKGREQGIFEWHSNANPVNQRLMLRKLVLKSITSPTCGILYLALSLQLPRFRPAPGRAPPVCHK